MAQWCIAHGCHTFGLKSPLLSPHLLGHLALPYLASRAISYYLIVLIVPLGTQDSTAFCVRLDSYY